MKYLFKVPELPMAKESLEYLKEFVQCAINYWQRVKNGAGYDWEKKLYTKQYLEPEFVDANISYFNEYLNKINKALKFKIN